MLRTLTLKSQLKFGKMADFTVEEIIQIEHEDYLRWVYYNSSNITFMPEILQQLGLTQLIQKPGINRELWEEIKVNYKKEKIVKPCTVGMAMKYKKIGKMVRGEKTRRYDKITHLSKADLQNKNRKIY